MPGANFIPLTDALGRWHDFYTLVGTASATLVGLLFVAASVGAPRCACSSPPASSISAAFLAGCLVILAPLGGWELLGALVVTCGLFGLAHAGLAWRDTVSDGLIARIDLEDRVWYLVMPIVG
jgi:hypothetical protein